MITISGNTQNLEILMKVLAFPKGEDTLFQYRKLTIQKKPNEEKPRLIARQLAGAGSVYSQVFIRPDGTAPFLNIEGEGDLTLDMKKALKNISELRLYKEAFIKHDPSTGITVFGSIKDDNDNEEYKTREPISQDIDDASGILGVNCDCLKEGAPNPSCTTCGGKGVKPAPALTYKNDIILVPPDSSLYPTPDVRLDVDSSIMSMIGDKSARFSDVFPIQFAQNSLVVSISDADDITKDSFKKSIPVTYAQNNMVGKQIWIGDYYKHVFGNLSEKITLWSANLPPDEESIYVTMNKPGGFHSGVQIQAKSKTTGS